MHERSLEICDGKRRIDSRLILCYTKLPGNGGEKMRISYNPLWKLLIDKGWNKKELREQSGISTASVAKLGKGENLTTDVLLKICKALDCDFSDIMEIVKDEPAE